MKKIIIFTITLSVLPTLIALLFINKSLPTLVLYGVVILFIICISIISFVIREKIIDYYLPLGRGYKEIDIEWKIYKADETERYIDFSDGSSF